MSEAPTTPNPPVGGRLEASVRPCAWASRGWPDGLSGNMVLRPGIHGFDIELFDRDALNAERERGVMVLRDRIARAGRDLALAAEAYMDAVDDAAMKRALLSGLAPSSDHRPLDWDQLQQAEEVEVDLRRGLQRAVYYWRKFGA